MAGLSTTTISDVFGALDDSTLKSMVMELDYRDNHGIWGESDTVRRVARLLADRIDCDYSRALSIAEREVLKRAALKFAKAP
jgi:hypothetical protein